jgi:hypothetical protein
MSGEQNAEGDLRKQPATQSQPNQPVVAEPDQDVTEALARVHEAVSDGELRESVEAAIEAIDSTRGTPVAAEGDPLGPVADALEGALEELEQGKIANLLPVIEQAREVLQPESSDPELSRDRS